MKFQTILYKQQFSQSVLHYPNLIKNKMGPLKLISSEYDDLS